MRLLISLCFLCLTAPAVAASTTTELAGTWVLISGDKPLMALELEHGSAG